MSALRPFLAAALLAAASTRAAPERPVLQVLAEDILRLELETQALRPLAVALQGKSFGEKSVDALEIHLALTASLLLANEGHPDADARAAVELGLSAAGLYYDLMRADLEATARGMSAVPRSNCNAGVEELNVILLNMGRDWRWLLRHRADATAALEKAKRYRDNVMAVLPVANVMKTGVVVANVTSGAISALKLARSSLPALAQLAQWLKEGGFEGASLELAGAGSGLAIRAIAGTQALVLSDATVIALAQAGQLAASSVALLYMARGHLHHICTDKNFESDARGGPWSPRFKKILDGAKLRFDDPENLVEVEGHQGPHPQAYHDIVYETLNNATNRIPPGTTAYREAVIKALRNLATRISTPGGDLNLLVTGGGTP